MCLIVKRGEKFKPSDGTVRCYKILVKKEDKYFTPFRFTSVDIKETLKAKGKLWRVQTSETTDCIEDGVIHCYKTESVAEYIMTMLCSLYTEKEYVLCACIIPEGVDYIDSVDDYKQLGTKEIEFVEEVQRMIGKKQADDTVRIDRSVSKILVNVDVTPA